MEWPKPTISMRKYDETACVNIRTHWSLVVTTRCGRDYGPTYELQVRRNAVDDDRIFVSHDASTRDPLELVTEDELNDRIFNYRAHEDVSHDAAVAFFADKVAVMTPMEAELLAHLTKHWEAFVLLFNPAYNL